MNSDLLPLPLLLSMAFILGTMFGSFASMASYRLPRHLKWGGRSFCDSCGRSLSWRDLVPLMTWINRKGRCGCGLQKISIRYPLMEALSGLAFVGIVWRYGVSLESLLLFILATLLVIAVTIDVETRLVPASLGVAVIVLAMGWRWLTFLPLSEFLWAGLMGGLIGLAMRLVNPALPSGIVHFLVGCGLIVGIHGLPLFLSIAALGICILWVWRWSFRYPSHLPVTIPLSIGLYLNLIDPLSFYLIHGSVIL